MTVEHRAAAAMPPQSLELTRRGNALALEVIERQAQSGQAAEPRSIDDRITAALNDRPQLFAELRALCRVRTATLYQRLAAMTADGRIVKSAEGYQLPR
jgi:hypothetical protein